MICDVYSAFGNNIRTKLILCLADRSKNVTEMIRTCGLSQSAVSQHLCKLKKAGVVQTQKMGKEVWYSLKYAQAAEIGRLLVALEKELA